MLNAFDGKCGFEMNFEDERLWVENYSYAKTGKLYERVNVM